MQKIILISLLAIGSPLLLAAQQTTLGDRNVIEEKAFSKTKTHPHRSSNKRSIGKLKRIKAKHTPQFEFYARVEKAAKEKQKLVKKLSAPQYADPAYFGHKRLPKRNSTSKMRYCKECGIRH